MVVHLDEPLRLAEQDGCHAGPAVLSRHVDLFDLVLDHHHESHNVVVDDPDNGVTNALRGAQSERFLGSCCDEFVRNMPQVGVAPSLVPDLRDCLRVLNTRGTKSHSATIG